MPAFEGRYAERDGAPRRAFWLRHNLSQLARRRRDLRDTGVGLTLHREWGAWTLRPVSGWRSILWITPPTHATRSVLGSDRGGAADWTLRVVGLE